MALTLCFQRQVQIQVERVGLFAGFEMVTYLEQVRYLHQEKLKQEMIKAYNGIKYIETHNRDIYEKSYEKRNKLFIDVEGRVSPNTV